MDGVHDMGGMHGFGKVLYRKDEPTFHHQWERRIFGLCQGATYPAFANLDQDRHCLELMPPDLYLSFSYFERWLYGLTTTLIAGGLVTLDEVEDGKAAPGSAARSDAAGPETVDPYAHEEYRREIDAAPRFRIGDHVRTGNPHPPGHTRLPRYARDKPGADSLAPRRPTSCPTATPTAKARRPCTSTRSAFSARDLWGPEAPAKDKVLLDIWECHLDPA